MISSAASPAGAPRARAAHTVDAQVSSPLVSDAGVGTARAADFAGADRPATAQSPAPGTVTRRRAVVRTMSMNARIQGGLTARQEQALSTRIVSQHQTPGAAPQSAFWTPAMGLTAVARAESWLGLPYSWAGGSASGPTLGRCDPGSGGDLDCHVVGFDCSGLAMYAWGAYASLPHLAQAQVAAGAFHPSIKQLLPGDLVFFSGYLPEGTGHVAIYTGNGMVIEAPQSGSVIRRSTLSALMASDVYRGAVRPLSGATPTLTAPTVTVPTKGGLVTLRGTNLTSVDAVQLGSVTVHKFTQHTDSTISFRAPAHQSGPVVVTVATTWLAQSLPVALTYVKPAPKAPVAPVKPTPVATSKAPAPPSTPVKPTAPPTKPVTPTPTPTSSAPTAPPTSASPSPSPTSSPTSSTTTPPASAPTTAATSAAG